MSIENIISVPNNNAMTKSNSSAQWGIVHALSIVFKIHSNYALNNAKSNEIISFTTVLQSLFYTNSMKEVTHLFILLSSSFQLHFFFSLSFLFDVVIGTDTFPHCVNRDQI